MNRHFSAFRDNYLAAFISAVFILLSVCAQAQRKYQSYPTPGQWKWFMTDSTAHIPMGPVPSLRGGDPRPGALFLRVRSSDTTLMIWSGLRWMEVQGSGGGISPGDTVEIAKWGKTFKAIPTLVDSTDPSKPIYIDSIVRSDEERLLSNRYYIETTIDSFGAYPLNPQAVYDAGYENGSGINKDNRINHNGFRFLNDSIRTMVLNAKAFADTAFIVRFGSALPVFSVTRNNGIQVGGATIIKTEGNMSILYGSNPQGMQMGSNGPIYIRGNSGGFPAFTTIKKDLFIASENSDAEGLYLGARTLGLSSVIWSLDKPGSRQVIIGARERGYTMYDSIGRFLVLDSIGFKVGGWTVDPAFGVNGMIIYRTDLNKFRAYQNGSWVDMIGGGGVSDLAPESTIATSNFTISEPSDHRQKTYIVSTLGATVTASAPSSPTHGQIVTLFMQDFGPGGSVVYPTFEGTRTLTYSGQSVSLQWSDFVAGYIEIAKSSVGGIKKVYAGNSLVNVNDSTLRADTSLLATRLRLMKSIDSLSAIINGKANSSHTHAAGDLASGTVAAARLDTAGLLASKFRLMQVADSITKARKVPASFTSGTTIAVDYNTRERFVGTLSHAATFSVNNMTDGEVVFYVINGSSPPYTPIFPGGYQPALKPNVGDTTMVIGSRVGSSWFWSTSAGVINSSVGTYSPTLTGENNVSSVVLSGVDYYRANDRVFVTGTLLVTPVSSGVTSTIIMSLPIASAFTASADCRGTFSLSTGLTSGGVVTGNSSADAAYFTFVPSANTSALLGFSYSYLIK